MKNKYQKKKNNWVGLDAWRKKNWKDRTRRSIKKAERNAFWKIAKELD